MINHGTAPQKVPVLKRVQDTIERYGMLRKGERVLVAVSGGPDSVALLHILVRLAPVLELHLAVAHLNHGLRAQASDKDEGYVIQLARNLGIPCHTDQAFIQAPARGSLEERAREIRYEYLNRLAEAHDYTKIAMGHHANDNAESVLLHLLRGSGIRGLGGIPAMRGNQIIRPLIHLQRNDIIAYLEREGLDYVCDESNQDVAFLRNRIRHQLIPMLERQYNPNIVATLNRTAHLCHDEEAWLQSEVLPVVHWAVVGQSVSRLTLRVEALQNAPRVLQRRVLRHAMRDWRGHIKRITADHIESILGLLSLTSIGKQLSLPFKIIVERTDEHLVFRFNASKGDEARKDFIRFHHLIETLDELPITIPIPQANLKLSISVEQTQQWQGRSDRSADMEWFDLDRLSFPLAVRNPLPGDRLMPFGMKGSQKLKKLFINRKIPRSRRALIPIVLSEATILWVGGVRRSAWAPITSDTEQALLVC